MKSLRQLYKIGRGPSSSHTMGPERACKIIKSEFKDAEKFKVTLYGSLALTGKGHLTDKIIEETFSPYKTEIIFDDKKVDLPHPNTMQVEIIKGNKVVGKRIVESIGGGAIKIDGRDEDETTEIYPHENFGEIVEFCRENNLKLWQYVEVFEGNEIWEYLSVIWQTMQSCIRKGLRTEGILAGGLNTERKAKTLFEQYALNESTEIRENRLLSSYAFACSEENASGGTVVTAPTCGSCGVLPSVLKYLQDKEEIPEREILRALAVAGVIGNVVKSNASISGAECGCQAEIGVACAMASSAVAYLRNMSIDQIEYSAEIAIEHHLGLTCDPICGLVQIPCIERNAVASLRAMSGVTLATFLSDTRKITFDMAVKTMYETGKDLGKNYRETAEGGLAKLYK